MYPQQFKDLSIFFLWSVPLRSPKDKLHWPTYSFAVLTADTLHKLEGFLLWLLKPATHKSNLSIEFVLKVFYKKSSKFPHIIRIYSLHQHRTTLILTGTNNLYLDCVAAINLKCYYDQIRRVKGFCIFRKLIRCLLTSPNRFSFRAREDRFFRLYFLRVWVRH